MPRIVPHYAECMVESSSRSGNPVSDAIFRAARSHKSLAARLLRPVGLRPGQELVLMTLWHDGPQRMVDLVQTLDSDAPSMTRSIARLEAAGLVQRRSSPHDRRATIVEASQASLALRPTVEAAWDRLEAMTASGLSAEQQTTLRELLGLVEAGLTAEEAGDEQ